MMSAEKGKQRSSSPISNTSENGSNDLPTLPHSSSPVSPLPVPLDLSFTASTPSASSLFSEISATTSVNSSLNKKRKIDEIDHYSKPGEPWRAKNYYEFVEIHKEFAQYKLCACEGHDKKFKHNNSTSNMTRHLANAHNVTNENPTGKVSICKLFLLNILYLL